MQRIFEAHQKYWSSKNAKNSAPIKPTNKRQKSSESSSSATTELVGRFVECRKDQSNFRILSHIDQRVVYNIYDPNEIDLSTMMKVMRARRGHYICVQYGNKWIAYMVYVRGMDPRYQQQE